MADQSEAVSPLSLKLPDQPSAQQSRAGPAAAATDKRTAPHTHIRGLGLGEDGRAMPIAAGFVGQTGAREAAGLVVDLVRSRRMSGRAVLLAGPPGTGKTAIALAMAQDLGPKVPFCPMVASEIYSAEVRKTEVLMEQVRRAIGLRVREIKEVYEGEVTELTVHEGPAVLTGQRAVSHITLGLKAARGTKTLRLDPAIAEPLKRARVAVGDVIFVEANSGAVRRLGRSDAYRAEHDLEAEEYVPLPKGEVHKKREVVQEVSLHDLDMANARPQAGSDIVSLVGNMLRPRRSEVTDKLRSEINRLVNGYIEQGAAELLPGVLFIDEAHMLDLEAFAFLNRVIESNVAPLIVLATNRAGLHPVRGDGDAQRGGAASPHGIPRDLLDRLLIIRTASYSRDELAAILGVRAKVEQIQLTAGASASLTDIGTATSLRYAAQLISPAAVLVRTRTAETALVDTVDVEAARGLFLDARRSAVLLNPK